jgi:hypothetical protein
MITLFTEQRDRRQSSFCLVMSVLVHGVVMGLIIYGLAFAPKIQTRNYAQHYTIRELNLQTDEARQQAKAGGYRLTYSVRDLKNHAIEKHTEGTGGSQAAQLGSLRLKMRADAGPQTILQPDIASTLALTVKTPIPAVLLWSKEKAPVKEIVAPQPQTPTAADVEPSVDPPNAEKEVSNFAVSSSDLPSQTAPILPANTSPVVVRGPEVPQRVQETTTPSTKPTTPAAVIATSDLKMASGTVSLPPVNIKSSSNTSDNLSKGLKGTLTATAPNRNSDSQSNSAKNGNANGKGSGDKSSDKEGVAHQSGTQGNSAGSPKASGQKSGTGTETGNPSTTSGSQAISGMRNGTDGAQSRSSTEKITLPKNGRFGAVVLGDSLRETYPESAEVWKGRLAYTVFLHVGTTKSWIFQYSLPRTDEAAAAGNITRLDAPWPYSIVRPNLGPNDIDSDSLLIHGFVNQEGGFENLSVVFPPQFAEEKFVLNSLSQWQFRPAKQGEQNVRVEVLLIIPAEDE